MSDTPDFLTYLRSLSPEELTSELQEKIKDACHDLDNDDAVAGEIAMTNATGFGVEDVEIGDVDLSGSPGKANFSFTMTGDQNEDQPWSGTTIKGDAVAIIDADESITIKDISAERDMDEFGDGDAE
jgi:hypothetical protein